MKALRSLFFVLVALVGVDATAAEGPNKWEAVIKSSDAVLRSFGFPRSYVEVTFPQSFPTNIVRARTSYELFLSSEPEKSIAIQGVRTGPNLHEDEDEDAESPSRVSRANLLPEIELTPPGANASYMVRVNFGSAASGDVPVKWPDAVKPQPEAPKSDNELINLFNLTTNLLLGRLHFQLDARSPFDGQHVPALDFQLRYDLAKGPLPWGLDTNTFAGMWIGSAGLEAEGTYKFDETDTNIADHINLNATFQLLRLYRLANPLTPVDTNTGKRQGRLAYYFGARLKGFELEADQEFDVVNWKIEPQLAAWVPYSNIPAIWWTRNVGINGNAATPLFVYAGYAFVQSVEEDASKVATAVQEDDRFEVELAYAFPLTSRIRVGIRSRFFWLVDENIEKNYQELFARYYLDKKSTASIVLKYTRGAVPPKFEKGDSVGAGFGIEF